VNTTMVKQLKKDLPDLLVVLQFSESSMETAAHHQYYRALFFRGPASHATDGLLCNVQSVDRIIYSIFYRFNLEWKTRTFEVFTQAA